MPSEYVLANSSCTEMGHGTVTAGCASAEYGASNAGITSISSGGLHLTKHMSATRRVMLVASLLRPCEHWPGSEFVVLIDLHSEGGIMAKVVSSEAQSMRRQARKAAEAAGHQWSELSKKDRKAYLALAGLGQGKGSPEAAGKHEQEGPGKQRREEAKRAAQQDGRKWRELSKEQRQEYLSRAGGKAKAT